ncbi:hypothetical protein D0863_08922 [Hortaea werneckii]|uniref:Carboxylic ester hydrolase n=1 Tax=Hortaea werneckii TaxID=91943 RepID=A0A3M7DPB2_HORWE|nr:hypothetical protein D0863_08922 [Hortaea werneckii]
MPLVPSCKMLNPMFATTAAASILLGCLAPASAQSTNNGTGNSTSANLPIVDLGYELHQAAALNGSNYHFTNIRYAAPPLGYNRFRAPQPPAVNRSQVQRGLENRICPQANPDWRAIATEFVPQYLLGKTEFNQSDFSSAEDSSSSSSPTPGQTEDCLFLDVVVPDSIFKKAGKGYGAPVLVWIYGGGYTLGSKSGSGEPSGLIARSKDNGDDGIIYVAMNYRLGAFGWLSGPTFQEDGTANAGLYDQRFALEWVQKHIYKFGGDPNRVTVFGESAGGGSIMHQITAYGGKNGPAPFQQAIPQSPGWQPIVSNQVEERQFSTFLDLLNVSTLDQARQLPSSALQEANMKQVGNAEYGTFVYGPTVDGNFVPHLPGELLLHGQFDKSVRVMVGHNSNEGLIFTSPFIQNNTAFEEQLTRFAPTIRAWPDVVDYVTEVLYPPVFDGSQAQGYTNQIARASALIAEVTFTSFAGNDTYAYYFAVPYGLHGSDVPYTYFTTSEESSVRNETVAIALQQYITQFAMSGTPNGDETGIPYFKMYGDDATVQTLNVSRISEQMDPTANRRCNWWQKALYY